jgi:hypothetical protein
LKIHGAQFTAKVLDAVEKLEKRGVVKAWPNHVESEHPYSKAFQSAWRQRGRLRRRFSDPPKSLFVCRVRNPTNFGSMPKMEFFNSIIDFWCAGKTGKDQRVQVSYREGVANHTGPESCVDSSGRPFGETESRAR